MRVEWTSLAESQAADAFARIAGDRPGAAVHWFESLVRRVESLATMPDQGRRVPEVQRSSIREVLVEPYRVIYRRDEARVVILTIQHQRRNLKPEDVQS